MDYLLYGLLGLIAGILIAFRDRIKKIIFTPKGNVEIELHEPEEDANQNQRQNRNPNKSQRKNRLFLLF